MSYIKNNNYKNHMKYLKVYLLLIVGAIFVIIYFSNRLLIKNMSSPHNSVKKDEVVATLKGYSLKESELKSKVKRILCFSSKNLRKDEFSRYENYLTDNLTKTEILYKEGKANGVKVSKNEVDREYDVYIDSIEQNYYISESKILSALKISENDLKDEFSKELIARKYLDLKCSVGDNEALDYYKKNKTDFLEVKVAKILIKNDEDKGSIFKKDDSDTREKAEKILKMACRGKNFRLLAKKYSDDENYGQIDQSENRYTCFVSKNDMTHPFDKVVFLLKDNQIYNKLIEVQDGYYIIKRISENTKPYNKVKDEIKSNIFYQKQNKLLNNLKFKYQLRINRNFNYKGVVAN